MTLGTIGEGAPLAGWTVPRPVFKRLEQITAPAVQVVTLAQLKAHLRITHTEEDAYLTDLIPAATEIVEQYLSRKLIKRQVRMWMDFMPGRGNEFSFYAGSAMVPIRYANLGMFRWFELFGMPVSEFDSFKFITNAGVELTFDPVNYIVDKTDSDQLARVILQRGAIWPVDLQVAHSVALTYSLGVATVAELPTPIVLGVKMVAGALWSNRGDASDQQTDILQFPAIRATLAPYRLVRIGG